MGVYINMEMPQNCGECLFKHLSPTGESLVCDISLSTVSWNERPFDCPLVHVPPHGDLINRDALIKELEIEELVETLRETADKRMHEAAEAIEELSRRAEEWEAIAESWQKACEGLQSRMPRWIPVTEEHDGEV